MYSSEILEKSVPFNKRLPFKPFEAYLKESRIALCWCSSYFLLTSGRGKLGYYFIKCADTH